MNVDGGSNNRVGQLLVGHGESENTSEEPKIQRRDAENAEERRECETKNYLKGAESRREGR
jgi:hypothetical protein